MPRRKRDEPRIVEPKQGRARATVAAIEQAIDEVVAKHGLEDFTARQVADRAGVGVGSLYRFFRTRDAMIASWELRDIERETNALKEYVVNAEQTQAPLGETLRELVKRTFRILVGKVRLEGETELLSSTYGRQALVQPIVELCVAALDHAPSRHPAITKNTRTAVRVAITSVAFGSLFVARMESEEERAVWVDEVGEMIVRYFVDPAHL